MSIKTLPLFKQPREKLRDKGPQSLSDVELLMIVLQSGTKTHSVEKIAKSVLPNGSVKDILSKDSETLCKKKGIGVSKALLIVAVCEIAQRLYQIQNSPYIESASDILKIVSHIKNRKREHFVALYLNARHQLIKTYTVSIGSLDASLAHPREVFEPAIRCHASSIIVSHNHPSGDPLPSQQDILLTKRLQHAGELLGIEMLDHIIIAQNGYISMRENKYM
jgi:DNA repair protein RadC